jgi:2-methylisocitrate lyase-like PEP mutase family enzyme
MAERDLVRAPEALSPLMARAVAKAGFEAMYLGGGAAAALQFGVPDLGLIAPVELVGLSAAIAASTDVPLVVDVDHCADGPLAVSRVVEMFEDAGVAALQIEDTATGKKVKGMNSVMPLDAFRRNLGAATAACSRGMVIIARTDAWMAGGDVQAVIERGRAAAEEGADAFFAPFTPRRYWETVRHEVPLPIMDINPVDDADRGRMKIAAYVGVLARRIAELSVDILDSLARDGAYPPITDASRAALSDLLDEDSYVARIPGATGLIDGRDTFGDEPDDDRRGQSRLGPVWLCRRNR